MRNMKNTILVLLIIILGMGMVYAGDGQIDIATLPYIINQPGSYVVVKNLELFTTGTHGITISVSNVTLDLNGHTLIGPGKAAGTSGSGIYVSGICYNIAIRNGTVRDWRDSGIFGSDASNSQFENLRCYNNGAYGILAATGNLIKENNCYYNGYDGISALNYCTILNNTCTYNDFNGITPGNDSTVSQNTCNQNGYNGIYANVSSSLRGNTCGGNGSEGIIAGSGSQLIENTCHDNGTNGINAYSGSTVSGNTCYSNTARGITAGSSCTVSRNTCLENGTAGIFADTGSLVSGNTCGLNTGDGIRVNFSSRVVDNSCANNGHSGDGAGINAINSRNSIEHNQVNNNDRGIDCNPATDNYIASNRASNNTTDYDIVAGNLYGQIINGTAGGQIASTDPYANFRF